MTTDEIKIYSEVKDFFNQSYFKDFVLFTKGIEPEEDLHFYDVFIENNNYIITYIHYDLEQEFLTIRLTPDQISMTESEFYKYLEDCKEELRVLQANKIKQMEELAKELKKIATESGENFDEEYRKYTLLHTKYGDYHQEVTKLNSL